jgi:L,D-transpeptidase ErfK/SrfK
MYGIHGTNIPWGVGMQVSHGCVRLYPEDIARLFPLIPVGTPGEFVYQAVKVGTRAGAVYVETQRDIYGYAPAVYREATSALARVGLADRVDQRQLMSALEDMGGGMPVRVSPESSPTVVLEPVGAPTAPSPLEIKDDGVPDTDDDEAGNG